MFLQRSLHRSLRCFSKELPVWLSKHCYSLQTPILTLHLHFGVAHSLLSYFDGPNAWRAISSHTNFCKGDLLLLLMLSGPLISGVYNACIAFQWQNGIMFLGILKSAQCFKEIVIAQREFIALTTTDVLKSNTFLKRSQVFMKVILNKNSWWDFASKNLRVCPCKEINYGHKIIMLQQLLLV